MGRPTTRVIYVDARDPEEEALWQAAQVLRSGGLVAFPTETVYGLGADATHEEAVTRLYQVKQRPPERPLIVHVTDAQQAWRLAHSVPAQAEELAQRFWPGPLTIVLPRHQEVPRVTCGGGDTIALRAPDHPIAQGLLRLAERPVAAPSANLSGAVSPVTAGHVLADFEGKLEMVLDGGRCRLGIESTVLDLTCQPPRVLRPGAVSLEALRQVIGEATWAEEPLEQRYKPRADVVLVEVQAGSERLAAVVEEARAGGDRVGLAGTAEGVRGVEADVVEVWGRRADAPGIARNLYVCLRRLDEAAVDLIVAEGLTGPGSEAAMHRLRSAAGRIVDAEHGQERPGGEELAV